MEEYHQGCANMKGVPNKFKSRVYVEGMELIFPDQSVPMKAATVGQYRKACVQIMVLRRDHLQNIVSASKRAAPTEAINGVGAKDMVGMFQGSVVMMVALIKFIARDCAAVMESEVEHGVSAHARFVTLMDVQIRLGGQVCVRSMAPRRGQLESSQ